MKILGIDIGGTGIKGAIVDTSTGKLLTERYRIPTPIPATPKAISKVVNDIVMHFNWKGVIGCGFPSVVQNNIVKTAINIDKSWIDINLTKLIKKTTKCKTYVINDADAAGLAEMKFGVGRNNNSVVLIITVGTGIGTALFTKGKILPNSELGQIIFKNGTAESYISARVKNEKKLSWASWANRFNKYLIYIEMLFNPDLIIIGGGISKSSDKYVKLISAKAKIKIAKFNNSAGIIGAAIFAELNQK